MDTTRKVPKRANGSMTHCVMQAPTEAVEMAPLTMETPSAPTACATRLCGASAVDARKAMATWATKSTLKPMATIRQSALRERGSVTRRTATQMNESSTATRGEARLD